MDIEKRPDGKIVLNTPLGLNLELLFADLSIKFKPKAEFIIHQANYCHKNGGYQVHSKNHCWFFGIKGSELALIINRLIDSGIITKARNYHPGNTSNTYRMVQPFDIATSQKSFYHPDEVLFIKKWVADGFIVKSAATSKFVKPNNTKTTIASQQKEINELKALLFDVLGKLNPTVPTSLPVDNCEQVAVSDSPTSTDVTLSEGQQGIQSPTVDANVKADSITNEEDVSTSLPVHETVVSTYLSAADLEALDELLLVFDGDDTPHTKEKIQLLSVAETISTADLPGIICDKPVEKSEDDEIHVQNVHATKSESFSNDSLITEPYDDTLGILYGDKTGVIVNFQEMSIWCSTLDRTDKERLYQYLMTATGNKVIFMLNSHTKAEFTRTETETGLIFNYQRMGTAA